MKLSTLLYTGLLSTIAFSAVAEEARNYKEETLTGPFLGNTRSSLANYGVDTDVVYKYDIMANVSGGLDQSARGLDNLDILFSLDGEKLLNLHGTSALIHVLNNNGGRPDEELVGSAQGIDNIEVSTTTAKLYQAWIQQNLFEDKLSILAGLYDVNAEFYVTDASSLFLHSTYGIGTEIAQAGDNGPSIFPNTSVGARVRVQPNETTYVQASILDGVPGSIGNQNGTQVELNNGDGTLSIAEVGYTPGKSKVAVGAWYFSEKFEDTYVAGEQHHNQGAYIIGQHKVYTPAGEENKGLALFARFGLADENVNQFDYAWSVGAVYTGLIPTRDEGQLGFGIAGAHTAKNFKRAAANAGTNLDSSETAFELTYSDPITPWLSIQPDVQYILNPGTDPAVDDAIVVGTRFTINF